MQPLHKQKPILRAASILLTAVSLGALTVTLVLAHPRLRVPESSPKPGELLTTAPAQVRLVFSVEEAGLVPDQSLMWVMKEDSLSVVSLGKVDLSAPGRDHLTAALAKLEPGVYLIKWVAVSAHDRGFSEGSFSFAVMGK